MTTLSVIALFVYVLGAFAYGSALSLSFRQAAPVWAPHRVTRTRTRARLDGASFALFALSAAWFLVQALIEFIGLTGGTRPAWLDVASTVGVFGFPPLIMHTMYLEAASPCAGREAHAAPRWARPALVAMYVVAPVAALTTLGWITRVLPRPAGAGMWVGVTVGLLFTVTGIYSSLVMTSRPRPTTSGGRRFRDVMLGLFALQCAVFVVLTFGRQQDLYIVVVQKFVRAIPLLFLGVTTYFENKFEFYDLVVKRGATLAVSVVLLGAFYAVAQPWFDAVPREAPRAWIFALAVVPVALLLPPIYAQLGRLLDTAWFGRHYTTTQAVTHVLGSMQKATDEATLVAAVEASLTDIFEAPMRIEVGLPDPHAAAGVAVGVPTASDPPVRIVVPRSEGVRVLLSEDIALLRSLAVSFGAMLENVRLHQKRQEQELLAHDLRLQTSRSELKALRAQINPHFLFNALNTIASLIHTDPARADQAVEQLAEVFRYTLRRSQAEWAPLDQELALAQAYLDVEHARFGERLRYTIEASPAARRAHVPAMTLQTLVENAVKHGISATRDGGHVRVVAQEQDGILTLAVEDDGPGLAPGWQRRAPRADGENFGLRNVRDRLAGHFGADAALAIRRDEARGVTVAMITLPYLVTEPGAAAGARG